MIIGRGGDNIDDDDLVEVEKAFPIPSNFKVPIQVKPSEQRNLSLNSRNANNS